MNCMMKFIQLMCCKRTPKATSNDYYIDPKLMLLGTPQFDSSKVGNKISEHEFLRMREAMIKEGGGWLKGAKIFFILVALYSLGCTAFGLGSVILKVASPDTDFEIPIVVNIVVMVLPNIILQMIWIFCVWKARNLIRDFLDWQNDSVYAARGINWLTCNTLMYIHIKVWNADSHAKSRR